MMWAGWIRFRASLMAMRRTSWIDHRINDEAPMVLFLPWFGVAFFWLRRIGMMADHRHHHRYMAMPAVPGSALVVIEPELVFGGLETVLNRPAMVVPAGHQVVKKARSPSAMRRRISRPRVHKPSFALLNWLASRSASSR